LSTILLALFVAAFTAVAAYVDWRWGKLPNWLTVPCFAAALVFHFVMGLMGWSGETAGWQAAFTELGWAILGFATGFSILWVLWVIGGGKAGDVKLMGALGAWLLPQSTLYVFIIACVFVVALVLSLIGWNLVTGRWSKMQKDLGKSEKSGATRKKSNGVGDPWQRRVPYGVPVALATWIVLVFQLCSK
jgi:prepilin peptidase CpaA